MFLRADPPKGQLMWLNIQANFFFAKSLARFLDVCNESGEEMQTFVYNTIKRESLTFFQEVVKQATFTSRVALANPKNVFYALIEVTNQLGYGWFEVLNYDSIKNEINIHVVDSIWVHASGLTGRPACDFIVPVIAAAAEVAHRKKCKAIQETCASAYDPTCSFRVKLSDSPLEDDFGSIKRLPGGSPVQDISWLSRNLYFGEKGWYYFFGHPLVLIPASLFPKLQNKLLIMDKDPEALAKALYNIFYRNASKVMQDICSSPKIAHSLRENRGLQKTVAFLLEEFRAFGWGATQQELMVFNEINREYQIALANSVIAENYPFRVNERVCHVFNATFAALVGVLHSEEYLGRETQCRIRGDATCEFHLWPV